MSSTKDHNEGVLLEERMPFIRDTSLHSTFLLLSHVSLISLNIWTDHFKARQQRSWVNVIYNTSPSKQTSSDNGIKTSVHRNVCSYSSPEHYQ